MTVSSGNASDLRELGQRRVDQTEAGGTMLEGEPELLRAGAGALEQSRVVRLREVDHAPVVAEVVVAQLREPVEAERTPHEGIEMPHEGVGEGVGARLLVLERVPRVQPGIDRVAVGAREPLGAMTLEHRVERAGGAAVRIADEDAVEPVAISASTSSTAPGIRSGVTWSFAGRQWTSTCSHRFADTTASTSR